MLTLWIRRVGGSRRRWEEWGLFRCSSVIGLHEDEWFEGNMIIFFPVLFPCTQGSRLVQEGRALPWYASLEGFLQATSRLFGCHWDCLKRICFYTILQGAPDQEKVDHPWALDTAFMHLSILRLRGWPACKNWEFGSTASSSVSWPSARHVIHWLH